ncbi:MAG: SRPBCC family protein [Chloroflexota bacterium]
MVKLHKSITINAPIDKVFAFMDDPAHLPEIWPSMLEVKDVTPAAAGGSNFGWVYKMAGMRFEGASETTEHETNKHTQTRSVKGIESKFDWNYKAHNGSTDLEVDIEYNVPIPLIGKLAESFIVKQNEHEADTLLANLKDQMETA